MKLKLDFVRRVVVHCHPSSIYRTSGMALWAFSSADFMKDKYPDLKVYFKLISRDERPIVFIQWEDETWQNLNGHVNTCADFFRLMELKQKQLEVDKILEEYIEEDPEEEEDPYLEAIEQERDRIRKKQSTSGASTLEEKFDKKK
eukprot:TRINITY_DN5100_c2_g1_i2.p1 TRINITY_DN5100_c2_g1~~TRINITY_DN5100_c2_g1_i2.p1  ORF type:complete len:145 (-),score=74.81 TRINITY_DN5100_c2_g1_i2:147-581(-)